MTRSDIGIILIIYATCFLFFYMTLQLTQAAQVYPMCLIAGLAILNTLYLFRCLIRMNRDRAKGLASVINDLPNVFKGFMPKQFLFGVCACIAYMGLLHYIGFYLSGAIYLIAVMIYLGVKPVQMAFTTLFLGALIYCVFTLFLKVPLPVGTLFS